MQIGLIIQKLVAIIYVILDKYVIKSMNLTFTVIENKYDMYILNLIYNFYFEFIVTTTIYNWKFSNDYF